MLSCTSRTASGLPGRVSIEREHAGFRASGTVALDRDPGQVI